MASKEPWKFSFLDLLFWPPVFLRPQLQIKCRYIARCYVKIACAPGGGVKDISLVSWGAGGKAE